MSVATGRRTTLTKSAGLALLAAFVATSARADQLMGQPTPGGYDLQPAGDALKRQVIFFHNDILMPIIVGISLFVLGLLVYVVIRFNKRANPTPAQFTHNTTIEVAWTAAPVLILMFIAIFSFRLLYAYHDMPKPDLTVKVTGNQWYWSYAYPDQGGFNFDSNMLPENKAKAAGVPYRLAVDNAMVVPVGKVVRVLVTGADVIHDFANPAFGLKTDAVPGRVNETWFKAEKAGGLLRPVFGAVRRQSRVHADRDRCGRYGQVQRLGRRPRRQARRPPRPRPVRAAAAQAPLPRRRFQTLERPPLRARA